MTKLFQTPTKPKVSPLFKRGGRLFTFHLINICYSEKNGGYVYNHPKKFICGIGDVNWAFEKPKIYYH